MEQEIDDEEEEEDEEDEEDDVVACGQAEGSTRDTSDGRKQPPRAKPKDKMWSLNELPPLRRHIPAEAGYEIRPADNKLVRLEGNCIRCNKICGFYCRYGRP